MVDESLGKDGWSAIRGEHSGCIQCIAETVAIARASLAPASYELVYREMDLATRIRKAGDISAKRPVLHNELTAAGIGEAKHKREAKILMLRSGLRISRSRQQCERHGTDTEDTNSPTEFLEHGFLSARGVHRSYSPRGAASGRHIHRPGRAFV